MKIKIPSFIFVIAISHSLFSQTCISDNATSPCCNGFISTDPRILNGTYQGVNTERPAMKNYFDWTQQILKWYVPAFSGGANGYVDQVDATQPLQQINPFYTTYTQLEHLNYSTFDYVDRTPDKLDFAPEFGWELLHKYDGYDQTQQNYLPVAQRKRDGPYFILYNKYSGKLRIFAAFKSIGVNQKIQTGLSFKVPSGTSDGYSALLSRQTNIMQPLDQTTDIKAISVASAATADGGFFTADFNTAYDPCVCHYESNLSFNFNTINEGDITLSGRLVGTSVPVLDGSGTAVTLNDRNFLTDVYNDDFRNVKAGALTYKNIDDLANKFKYEEGLSDNEALGVKALLGVMKSGATATDKLINKGVSNFLSSEFGGLQIGPFKVPSSITASLGIVGSAVSFLSSIISPAKPPLPNIGFIEAEMALSGQFTSVTPLGGSSEIELRTPGSKNTNDAVLTPDINYPAYNEALGVFAVMETPVLYRTTIQDPTPGQRPGHETHYTYFSFKDLKYYYNPAAEVDVDNTSIVASLVFSNVDNIGTLNPVNVSKISTDANGMSTYITPYVNLECLPNMTVMFTDLYPYAQNYKTYIKLMIEYQFKPNKYGKVNKHFEILTYPVTYVTNPAITYQYSFANYSSIPQYPTISGQYFSTDQTLYAWNKMTVNGNVTVAPMKKVRLVAGEDVEIIAGEAGPEVEVISGEDFYKEILNCGSTPKILPVSADYVKTFCTGSQYKAKTQTALRLMAQATIESQSSIPKPRTVMLSAIPNPATNNVTFLYSLTGTADVQLYLTDIAGHKVADVVSGTFDTGAYQKVYDISGLPAGIYLYTLETSAGYKETQRLSVVK